ncbi:Stk1 family PASTA domain-containing Ser/Thr kinase [Rothia sp. CCM 9419]|uniref:Stk1 family PASTA domain-containing Ser/Thr kinase n=1 Tax=Rothia sp. CCM 9419 TaxID=3402662 RepID=UPI003ADE1A8D
MEFQLPEMIDKRYRIQDVLGSGAMATVYSAEDTRLGRRVALKVVHPELAADPLFCARFQREAEAAAVLNHPAIVAVYDTGTITVEGDDETPLHQVPYLVMELVSGKSLATLLDERGELPVAEAVAYGTQVLEALQYANDQGITHRGIRPTNIMVLPSTEEDRSKNQFGQVKVLDFGLDRALENVGGSSEPTEQTERSHAYIAPEQVRGETVDSRSDIYSVACVIYQLLCGRPPFIASSAKDLAHQHLSETPADPSSYASVKFAPALDGVLLKALSKSRSDRFQSADEFRSALENVVQGVPSATFDDVETGSTTALSAAAATGVAGGSAAYSSLNTSAHAQPSSDEAAGLGGWFDNAQAEYTDEELYDYERNEALAKKRRRRQAWTRVITGMIIAALALFSVTTVLYYQNELKKVPVHQVPAVQGLSKNDAETAVRNLNLTVKWDDEFSDAVAKNDVIKSTPVTGTEVEEGSEVLLTLSKGPSQLAIPDNIEGQSEAYVRSALQDAGFVPGRTSTVNSATIPAGMVVSLSKEPGSKVAAGSTIDIVLSDGKVTVPELIGLSRDQAIAALSAPDVLLSTNIETVQTNAAPAGTVLSQSSAAGTTIGQGSTVTIRVAAAPPAPTVAPRPRPTVAPQPERRPVPPAPENPRPAPERSSQAPAPSAPAAEEKSENSQRRPAPERSSQAPAPSAPAAEEKSDN